MYFTRNNYYKDKFEKNSQDIHALKIYKASLVNGEWKDIVPMPFNNDEYNVAHPTLNESNTKLYFASDMPGTLGASDIYLVDINEDGTYGVPENLGAKINTEGRENFPFVSDNGTLYFSSNGHVGLGGLDIFKFKDIGSISTSNETVINMGKPINSPKDDFSYIVNEKTYEGYLSSNREEGKGDDDIYKFKRNPCSQIVAGTVVDKSTNRIIAEAHVTIFNSTGEVIKTFKSDANGAFNFDLSCAKNLYKALGEKDKYKEDAQEFVVSENNELKLELKLSLTPEKQVAAIGTDLFILLNLNPIYFDYDKSFIRPDAEIELAKIINYMNEFSNVKIDVRSHTDSRGRDAYNFALSNRRNDSTREYIVNMGGISADKLSGKGYGETQLTNKCSNGVKSTDAEHQANRRSEFIVVAN